jgi:hypothetical protein
MHHQGIDLFPFQIKISPRAAIWMLSNDSNSPERRKIEESTV